MDTFVENLRDLISEKGLSLRQLAKESGVTATQYSRYLRGAIPTIGITLKIAEYFDCSLDYLFGLTDTKKKNYKTYNYDISKFISNYKKLLNENNISNYKFLKDSIYDESIIRHWEAGSVPRLDVVYYIAKNLGGSIDELIGRY